MTFYKTKLQNYTFETATFNMVVTLSGKRALNQEAVIREMESKLLHTLVSLIEGGGNRRECLHRPILNRRGCE